MMNDQIAKMIQQMAQQLGVAATHLWGVLVKAQIQSGITYGLMDILFTVLCGIAIKVLWMAMKRADKMLDDFDSGLVKVFIVIGMIAAVIIGVIMLYDVSAQVMHIVNPEYFALQELLGAIHK